MTYEEFMATPFKYGGEGEQYLLEDELPHINRSVRRWIKSELSHGRKPSFEDIYSKIKNE